MGLDGVFCKLGKKIGVLLFLWRDICLLLLMEEVLFVILVDIVYVKFFYEFFVMGMSDCDEGDDCDVMKFGFRVWSWLKLCLVLLNGCDFKEVVYWGFVKFRFYNIWNWL